MTKLVNFSAYAKSWKTAAAPSPRSATPPRASCRSLPSLVRKVTHLCQRSPGAAAVVERLVDDILRRLNER